MPTAFSKVRPVARLSGKMRHLHLQMCFKNWTGNLAAWCFSGASGSYCQKPNGSTKSFFPINQNPEINTCEKADGSRKSFCCICLFSRQQWHTFCCVLPHLDRLRIPIQVHWDTKWQPIILILSPIQHILTNVFVFCFALTFVGHTICAVVSFSIMPLYLHVLRHRNMDDSFLLIFGLCQ